MARKAADISLVEWEKLAALHCTQTELAAFFGVSQSVISRRMAQHKYAEAWERGWARGNISLRRMQFQAAEAGDKTMLVWLGKQWLGQSDRGLLHVEHTGKDGGPVEVYQRTESEIDAEFRRLLGNFTEAELRLTPPRAGELPPGFEPPLRLDAGPEVD